MFPFSAPFLHLFQTRERLLLFNSMAEQGLYFSFCFVSSRDYVVLILVSPLFNTNLFWRFWEPYLLSICGATYLG